MIAPLSPVSLAPQGGYFTPSIKGIWSPVKSLCPHAFDFEEWQSIFDSDGARDRAIDVLEANTVVIAGAKHTCYNIPSSCKTSGKERPFPSTGLLPNSLQWSIV